MEPRDELPDDPALLQNAAWVKRLARRLIADAHLAEDVAQDTMAAALERPPGFAGDAERLRRWLGGVTRHLAARARRREGEREAREARAARAEASGDGGTTDRLRLHQRVVAAVVELDEPYRSTVVMRYFDELSPRQIAHRQGIPPATVRKRLSRAMATLRARLGRELDGGAGTWCVALAGLLDGGAKSGSVVLSTKAVPAVVGAAVLTAAFVGWRAWKGHGEARPTPDASALLEPPDAGRGDAGRVAAVPAGPGAERRAIESDVPATPVPLEVRVLDRDGGAVEDALVVLVAGGEVGDSATTDADGRARFEARELGGQVIAQAPGVPPRLQSLERLSGRHELVLGPGASLSGWLLEDGDVPREPIRLRLGSHADPLDALDETVQESLASVGVRLATRELVTDASGAFAFHGLPADWSGWLRLPTTHWFADAPPSSRRSADSLEIAAAEAGLVLRTTRLPGIRGRVLDGETGAPVAGAGVMIVAEFVDHSTATGVSFNAGEDGRFVLGLAPGSSARQLLWRDPANRSPVASASVSVNPKGECLGTWAVFRADDIGPDGDVGDIRLARGRALHLLVRDESGAPIPGAIASGETRSEPTDSEGRTRLPGLGPDRDHVLVGAPGHRIQRVAIGSEGSSAEDAVEVALERGNRLDLAVVCTPPSAAQDLRAVLTYPGRLFELGNAGWGDRLNHDLGSATMSSSRGKEGGWTKYRLDDEGRLTLLNLAPSVELEVEVRTSWGWTLARERLQGPGYGETVRHELIVTERAYDLAVKVRDGAGQPLPRVRVQLRGEHVTATAYTDDDGAGLFANVFAPPESARLEATRNGYAPAVVEGILLAPDTRLPDLVLERGHDVELRVVDASGARVPASRASASAPGRPPMRGEQRGPGIVLFTDLPSGSVELKVSYGCRKYTIEHDTEQPEATIVVPVHGELELAPAPAFRIPEDHEFTGTLKSLDDGGVDTDFWCNDEGGGQVFRMPLVPGRYEVRLQLEPDSGPGRPAAFGREHLVEVRAREVTRLPLGD